MRASIRDYTTSLMRSFWLMARTLRALTTKISWHKTKTLNWHHFEPEYLPPRTTNINAIEWLWLPMMADWFNGWIAQTSGQLQDRIIEALRFLFDQPSIPQSQCRPRRVYHNLFDSRSKFPRPLHGQPPGRIHLSFTSAVAFLLRFV
jgi:hypothetical protein